MARLEILEFPDPRLRTVAKAVDAFDEELASLAEDMLETMYQAQGIGLAATQVDVHRRLLVMDTSEERNSPRVFVNPEIVSTDGEQVCEEGCLSVPGVFASVARAERVRVRARKPDGSELEVDLDGLEAVCLQHEMDHLEGTLFVDYLSPLKQRLVKKRLEKQRRQGSQDQRVGAAL